MSLQPQAVYLVPEDTARVARAAFPKGNVYLRMHDELGRLYADRDFASLFPTRGQPALAPAQLALVTLMQFAEGLSDRQAAEAVRGRIDWKYALGLELTDDGFDFSVLCEFRARLVAGSAEHLLLDKLLAACREGGLLKARGRQRTDSTHVLGALRVLSRLENVAEALRAALEAVAAAEPAWLRGWVPPGWFGRYGRRIEEYRLPRGKADRQAFAATVGADGVALLAALDDAAAPPALRELPAVAVLRQIWGQQFAAADGGVRLRDVRELPPASEQIETPHDPEARYGLKRETRWTGYKVHLTETCDDDRPHLLTQVETTVAPAADVEQLAAIQAALGQKQLLPGEQLVDASYVRGSHLVDSRTRHGIDPVGPVADDHQWQAQAGTGFDISRFRIDWAGRQVSCPRGRTSEHWYETETARGAMVRVAFAEADCAACPARADCTRAKTAARSLTLQPRAEHVAIQAARRRQQTAEFATLYARRAGVEGTVSQGVRAFGLRTARYRGLARTHLQHVATAAALNVHRVADWLNEVPRATTRRSAFAQLAPAA